MKIKFIHFLFFVALMMFGCKGLGEKKLADVEKRELAKGVRQDSIFQGIYLAMPKQEFFDYCWAMNKKNVFTEGSDKSVEYQLGKQNFNYRIQMNFYPSFIGDKIAEMPMKFSYFGIDLTVPRNQNEKLMNDVKTLMEEWYGKDFFKTDLPFGGKGWAKVTGNRRVLIFSEKEFEVMVLVSDLTVMR